ncbi:MAG: Glycolate dehydrogenase, FAD-binding subunit GlcE [uncultured Solirubrobacteraceae bacterium]|uniref:Glycolate dehydrogenase, FAD-binding subunit GlcE n=1 Tax=uncultured Solirubrobacteraceae bacterium TaxID=1162706 RepID=A0A6J4SSJ4_9ACTN|nr:MAG: Glycolate dehydrogenase, FAD-binding subunit GlcE [uncultured Solirubrobacteraceae bacterium]
MTLALDTVEALQDAVREGPRVLPVGGGTKPAQSEPPSDDVVAVDVSGLRGIVDYDPAELTFTALAGTPVAEIDAALGEHGQYLPFDPPLAAAGATLGGVVAAGTSGSNAFRHGGVRDFVLGVRFVDGTGRLVAGGGRVVKNAAGFDLPKLMVGSAGRLGVIVQLSLKVFPRPRATTTLSFALESTQAALGVVAALGRSALDLDALDLEPPGRVLVRVGGDAALLDGRAARLAAAVAAPCERIDGPEDAALWREVGALGWVPAGSRAVRVGLTARDVAEVQAVLEPAGAPVRYSLGANAAWIAWPEDQDLSALDGVLSALGVAGMVLTGPSHRRLLGAPGGGAFADRIRAALDPDDRFPKD